MFTIFTFLIFTGMSTLAQIAAGQAQVTAVQYQVAGDHIRVVVHFDRPVRFVDGTAVDPYRIFFDLQGTRPADALASKTAVGDSVLQSIRVAQYQPEITRVVLDVTKQVPYRSSYMADPPQLVIDLSPSSGTQSVPAAVSAVTSKASAARDTIAARVPDLQPLPAAPPQPRAAAVIAGGERQSALAKVPQTAASPIDIAAGQAQVTAVQYQVAGDHIRVVVHFDRPVRFVDGTAVDPYRIFFDLQGTRPADALASKTAVGDSVLQSIRVAQYQPEITRVVLDVTKQVPYRSSYMADPPQLVIDLSPSSGTQSVPAAVSAVTSKASAAPDTIAARVPDLQPLPAAPPQPRAAAVIAAGGERQSALAKLPQTAASPTPRAYAVDISASAPSVMPPTKPSTRQPPFAPAADRPDAVVPTPPTPSVPNSHEAGPLATRFASGAKPVKDPTVTMRSYLQAAQLGSIDAQFQLANLYMNGTEVPRNPTEAARWYTHAAQQGHALAASNLGVLYANGWGVAKDDAEAVRWFGKAAEEGDEAGQANLGAMYLTGRGVSQSDVQGANWLRTAATRGVPEAQYGLGTLFANGRGVPHNDVEAAKWLQKSADQGYALAQFALGKLYVTGTGVPRDYQQAMSLFQRANLPEAWHQIGRLYQQGLGVPRNDSEAMAWFLKAASHRLPDAQYALGEAYQNRDPVEAYSWFALAASNGYRQGVVAMNSLALKMTAVQLQQAQDRALSKAARTSN